MWRHFVLKHCPDDYSLKNVRYDVKWVSGEYIMIFRDLILYSKADYSLAIFLRLFLKRSSLDYFSEIFFKLFLKRSSLDYSSEIFFRPFLRDLLQTIPQRGTLVRTPLKW